MKILLLFCAAVVLDSKCTCSGNVVDSRARSSDFSQLRAILPADQNQIIVTRGKCYQDFPVSSFHLFAKFAWRLQNPTVDCFLRCVMKGLSYMDDNGVIKNVLMKEKIESNTEGKVRELLTENVDICSENAAKSNSVCEKSFDFLHCFYRSSLLTSLFQSLELFKYGV